MVLSVGVKGQRGSRQAAGLPRRPDCALLLLSLLSIVWVWRGTRDADARYSGPIAISSARVSGEDASAYDLQVVPHLSRTQNHRRSERGLLPRGSRSNEARSQDLLLGRASSERKSDHERERAARPTPAAHSSSSGSAHHSTCEKPQKSASALAATPPAHLRSRTLTHTHACAVVSPSPSSSSSPASPSVRSFVQRSDSTDFALAVYLFHYNHSSPPLLSIPAPTHQRR